MRLAWLLVGLAVLPWRVNTPLLASVVAFTLVEALRLALPMASAPALVSVPPKFTALPPSPLVTSTLTFK